MNLPNIITLIKFKKALCILALLTIITSSFFFHNTSSFFWNFQYHPLIFESATFISCALIVLAYIKNKTLFNFYKIDFAIGLFLIYCLTITLIKNNSLVHNNEVYLLLCYYFIYLFIRQSKIKPEILFIVLVAFGILNVFIAIAQALSGLLNNSNGRLVFTGAFDNSAPFAGFLAGLLPLAVFLSKKYSNYRYFFIVTIILFIAAIIVSSSRAALVAVILLFTFRYLFSKVLYKSKNTSAHNLTALAFFIIIGIGSIINYYQRPASVQGRLLIWKVGFLMIKNSTLLGNGGGYVKSHYNLYQAQYFHNEGGSNVEKYLANEIYFVFNEFLRIVIEYGLIGLVLFLATINFSIRPLFQRNKDPLYLYSVYTIIVILIFGMFSYPLSIIPINLLFYITIAVIAKSSERKVFTNHKIGLNIKALVTLLLLLLLKQTLGTYQAVKKWEKAQDLWNYDEASAIQEYESIEHPLSKNTAFLFNYGTQLVNLKYYKQGVNVLKKSSVNFNAIDTYTQLGKSTFKLTNTLEAEKYFLIAKYISPNKLTPKLNLFNFYVSTSKKTEAKKIANEILATPIKIPTTIADSIKVIAKKYLISN